MSTNFLVFNPTLANAETDTTYSSDSMRTGGATSGAILGSPLFNKACYQWSTFVAAFCTMMANKGVSTSDANFANLVTALTTVRLASDFPASVVSVPYATAVAFNAATSSGFDLVLTGNVTSSTISGQSLGQILTFVISQDATGSRTFPWPTNVPGGAICPLANSITIQAFFVRYTGAIVPLTLPIWSTSTNVALWNPAIAVTISASGNVSADGTSTHIIESVNASGGAINRTLPSAALYPGIRVDIQKSDSTGNAVNVLPQSGQTISGFPSVSITNPLNSFTMLSVGGNWILA